MKKILLFTLSSLMFSCVTVNPSILKPGNNEIKQKLHKLYKLLKVKLKYN